MQKVIFTIAFLAGIFSLSCNSNSSSKNNKSEKETITVTEADILLKEGAILVDVRDPDELETQSYDVKEVKNIPLAEIETRLTEIPQDKQVILACQKGGRSKNAFDLLKAKGYTNISNMEGGMNAWESAGLPTKIGKSSDVNSTETKSCCPDPNSKDCNPDGTCKPSSDTNSSERKSNSNKSTNNVIKNHLEVYCFHGTRQCETCINMKANTKATLDKYFSEELKNGSITFSIIDVDEKMNEMLAEKYQATGTALMVNNMVDGKDNIIDWSDFAFDKANNPDKFIPEFKVKIDILLNR